MKKYIYGTLDSVTGIPSDLSVAANDAEFSRGFAQSLAQLPPMFIPDITGYCYGELEYGSDLGMPPLLHGYGVPRRVISGPEGIRLYQDVIAGLSEDNVDE